MSSFFISRSQKKKAQRKKNRHHLMIYENVRLRREEDARLKEEDKQRQHKKTKLSEAKKEDDLVWSAKLGEVRNRLTDKKRASKERWNRFAGTESGGARGL